MYRVAQMLTDVRPPHKRVYVLIGNEPFEAGMGRIREVIEWGCEPHVQPIMKLNAPRKVPWVRFDWTEALLKDVARWANKWVWRKASFDDYRPPSRRRIAPKSVSLLTTWEVTNA